LIISHRKYLLVNPVERKRTARRAWLPALVLAFVVSLSGVSPAAEAGTCGPLRLAVLYFDNNSITDRELLEPFRKGLADTLISDLGHIKSLRVVERERIDAILSELQLMQSGAVDERTAQKVGKVLGVQALILGCFTAIGPTLRIDARVVDVETTEVITAQEICGDSEDFFDLEDQLVTKIAGGLAIKLSAEEKESITGTAPRSFEAVTLYSQGLDLMDRKNYTDAAARFAGALEIDPGYEDAARMRAKAKERIAHEGAK
jgi:TolB-like protein